MRKGDGTNHDTTSNPTDTIGQREEERSNDGYGDGHRHWHWENNHMNIEWQVLSFIPWFQCMSNNESILSIIENTNNNNQEGQ